MRSAWALSAVHQLMAGVVHLGLRELVERQPAGPEPEPPLRTKPLSAVDAAKFAGFTLAFAAVGAWSFGWLGSAFWWLVTGRGPGGRLLAAGAVTPRPYTLRP